MRTKWMNQGFGAVLLAALAFAGEARPAQAFCGFYVNGQGGDMFNDATQVTLMRLGTRTVLAMQNNYQGPADAFALVIPVPTVLREADVKTLPKDVFERVDKMGAPRLVEYWEQDPCAPVAEPEFSRNDKMAMAAPTTAAVSREEGLGVTIEAQFTVGEYQIVILSATDSTGLETWLRREQYQIPAGAEPLLRPYVEGGMKFFVAKVDPAKVAKDEAGRLQLSPLRFHYDSDEFNLPIRLGLANSSGTQDLIVNIFAPGQRYDVANYPNVTIPTNLEVANTVRDRFGSFYTSLYDATVAKHPGAVVTEYAWQATSCDPCPGPQLTANDLATLGADVLQGEASRAQPYTGWDMVFTRLHARYGKTITDDLVFKTASPIVGGREHVVADGKLEEGAQASGSNNFQGRYAIRHRWTGPVSCAAPAWGRWGGPPADVLAAQGGAQPQPKAATGLAFVARDAVKLPEAVRVDIPELGIKAVAPAPAPGASAPTVKPPTGPAVAPSTTAAKKGCGGCASGGDGAPAGWLVLALWFVWPRRSRRAQRQQS